MYYTQKVKIAPPLHTFSSTLKLDGKHNKMKKKLIPVSSNVSGILHSGNQSLKENWLTSREKSRL